MVLFAITWEQRKLKHLSVLSKGQQLGKYQMLDYGSYYVLNGGINPSGYTDSFNTLENTISISEGGNSCGYVNYNIDKFWSGGHNYTLSNLAVNSKFLYHYLKLIEPSIMALRVGSGLPNVQKPRLESLTIAYPKDDEQNKLAKYFDGLDNLITLHQRKYEKLKNIKNSLLQKMFPKEGANIPEVRFKGFTDAWEQCKFENVFNYERPDNYIVKSDKYNDSNNTPVLTANKGFILGYTNETNTYNDPCIIFDDFTLDSKYVDFKFMVKSSAMKILTTKENYDLRFSFERLNSTKMETLGHARHYISVVQPTVTFIPTKFEEQRKISHIFKSIDNLITLHQRKLQNI